MKRSRIAPVSARRRAERDQSRAVVEEVRRRDGDGCWAAALVPEVECGGPLDADEIVLRSSRPGGHLDPDQPSLRSPTTRTASL